MRSAKVTAILMIIAIFNPLCCCLNLFANDLPAEHLPAAAHACCSVTKSSDSTQKSDHSKSDCPHQSEKQYQINEVADSHTSFAKTQVALLPLLFCLDLLATPTTHSASHSLAYEAAAAPNRVAFTETYCVYIL